MKSLANLKLIAISMLLAAALAACDKPGPAETAGKKIDQATENAGNKISAMTDKLDEKLNAQDKKIEGVVTDSEITAKVKAAIFAESGLKTLQISVDTLNGVVTLSGSVESQASSDRAKTLAGAVVGVKKVENLLVLK